MKQTSSDKPPLARLTVRGPGAMTPAARRQIAAWLRKQAAALVSEGQSYTCGRFTARLLAR